jgi:hypothetical protein
LCARQQLFCFLWPLSSNIIKKPSTPKEYSLTAHPAARNKKINEILLKNISQKEIAEKIKKAGMNSIFLQIPA